MEGGFIARPPLAVLRKPPELRAGRELSGFWPVFSDVLPAWLQFGYRAAVPKLPWLALLRVVALVALAASAALLSDYVAGTPSFCSAASGCGIVRQSEYSHITLSDGHFIPLPAFGLAGFALLFGATFLSRSLTIVTACIGGLAALWLLWVQAAVVQHFCWLCVTTDVSALVAAASSLGLRSSVWEDELRARLHAWAWWALGALSVSAPLAWPLVKISPPVPAAVLSFYQPSKVNVVEFADFECPACRRFSGILKDALAPYSDRVNFIRLNKPLDMHEYARDAARAYVCAQLQQRGEPMAEALFASPDLKPAAIDKLAQAVGLDAKQFDACMLEPSTNARVDHEASLLVPPELEGLPTTYIGGKRLLGVQSAETVADALEKAARGEGTSGISGYVYLPTVALCGLLILRFGLRRAVT